MGYELFVNVCERRKKKSFITQLCTLLLIYLQSHFYLKLYLNSATWILNSLSQIFRIIFYFTWTYYVKSSYLFTWKYATHDHNLLFTWKQRVISFWVTRAWAQSLKSSQTTNHREGYIELAILCDRICIQYYSLGF